MAVVFDGHILVTDRAGQAVRALPVSVNVQEKGFHLLVGLAKQNSSTGDLQINRAEIVLPSTEAEPNYNTELSLESHTREGSSSGRSSRG